MAVNMDAILKITAKSDTTGLTKLETKLNAIRGATVSAVAGIGSSLAGVLGLTGGVAIFSKIFGDTATLEKQTKSLEVLLGSAEKASAIVAQLQSYGSVTPFEATDLIETAKRLGAFGVAGERVVEVTKRLGDIAGATGSNIDELATAYGQVVAKGRLQTEELLQFQERGVGIQGELQKMYGMSGQALQKALSDGKISAEAFEAAIVRLTEKGGKYAGGALAQSDTLNGKFSTLQDSITALSQKIGNELSPAIKQGITWLTDLATGLDIVYVKAKPAIGLAIDLMGKVAGVVRLVSQAGYPAAVALDLIAKLGGAAGLSLKGAETAASGVNTQLAGTAQAAAAIPPLIDKTNNSLQTTKQQQEQAKQLQEAFKASVDMTNASYERMNMLLDATNQRIQLAAKYQDARINAEIEINNAAKAVLQVKLDQATTEAEKIPIMRQIAALDYENARLRRQALAEQIDAEVRSLDNKRKMAWQDKRAAEDALTLARYYGQQADELERQLDAKKAAANAADREYITAQKIADERRRAADAQLQAERTQSRARANPAPVAAARAGEPGTGLRPTTAVYNGYPVMEDAGGNRYHASIRNGIVDYVRAFAGGGYTGNAPRTGGIDGKGGFMAVLHPRETVIDHTRSPAGGRPGITIQTGPVLQQPDGSRWVSMEDLERGMAMAVDQALGIVASPAGRMALGGA